MNSADLSMFTGTENYHRFSLLFRRHVLTDGAKYLAENCGAYWLMDAIASHHPTAMKNVFLKEFQIWFLRKTNDKITLTCFADTGSGNKALITQKISHSDFFNYYDGDEIKLYVARQDDCYVIMLPNEY